MTAQATRIRNVVFDMGGVLLRYDPVAFARPFVNSVEDACLVAHEVFEGREWVLQDAGAVGIDTIAWTAAARLPERLADAATQTAYHWFENRVMYQEMDPLIRDLKARGYGIYLLSNAGLQFSQYKTSLPAYDCFDGMVVSAFVHLMKPDRQIFELLAHRYGIVPEECLFVDDVPANVAGAERVGMQGLVYTGNPDDIPKRLGITP